MNIVAIARRMVPPILIAGCLSPSWGCGSQEPEIAAYPSMATFTTPLPAARPEIVRLDPVNRGSESSTDSTIRPQ